MMKLLNLEIRINQIMKEIETNSIEVTDYLENMDSKIEKEEAIELLTEIPDILKSLEELLQIYVESVEEEYAKL